MFDFFRRRHERESAVHVDSGGSEQLGSFARSEGQPVVGEQVSGQPGATELPGVGGLTDGLEALGAFGPMIQKALAESNVTIAKALADGGVTIEQGPTQTIDMRGTGLREEILQIMQQHGVDAEAGTAGQSGDPKAYVDMQQQILAALAKHGIDPGASGSSVDFQVKPADD
jgi:hypothetical protein